MAVIGFIAIFKDLGLSMATVQRAELNHGQVSTMFWINFGVSALIMVFIVALAPLLAWYYREPRVAQITLVLAGTIIFSGLIVQHQALLRRQMRFGLLAIIETTGLILSFAGGIMAALSGWGYWSLVVIPVVREISMMIGVWVFCRWRPGRPVRRSGVRDLVSFGAHLTGFNVLNYFARNLDKILIGRFSGAAPLGFYNKAYQMLLLPVQQITNPISGVAVPTLSRLQNQPERYRAYYRTGVFLTVTIGMPLVAFLFVAADKAVLTLLGDQWLAAVPIFRVLGPAAYIGTCSMATGWVYLSLGRTKRLFAWGVFASTAVAVAFLIGIRWGPIGIAYAYSGSVIVLFPLALVYCFRGTILRLTDFIHAIRRPTVASLAAAVGLYGIGRFLALDTPLALALGIDLVIYMFLYIAIWIGLPNGRQAAREVIDMSKQIRPSPPTPPSSPTER